jgi:hypothetical protein
MKKHGNEKYRQLRLFQENQKPSKIGSIMIIKFFWLSCGIEVKRKICVASQTRGKAKELSKPTKNNHNEDSQTLQFAQSQSSQSQQQQQLIDL